jgi:hypothetical protein
LVKQSRRVHGKIYVVCDFILSAEPRPLLQNVRYCTDRPQSSKPIHICSATHRTRGEGDGKGREEGERERREGGKREGKRKRDKRNIEENRTDKDKGREQRKRERYNSIWK